MLSCYYALRESLMKHAASKAAFKNENPPDDNKLSKEFKTQLQSLVTKGALMGYFSLTALMCEDALLLRGDWGRGG
jgi:hypothetical protein